MSAYCQHLAARLDKGCLVGDRIECPLHLFEFDSDGVATGFVAPPSPTARLFAFPVVERFGFIWSFNGEEPLWDLPGFAFPDEKLHFETIDYGDFPADPYVVCCNTPDYHHFRIVHGPSWDHPDPHRRRDFRWIDHSLQFDTQGRHWGDVPMDFTFGIYPKSIYYLQGWLGDDWYGLIAIFTINRPGLTKVYFSIAVRKGHGSPQALDNAKTLATRLMALEKAFVNQDIPILDGIRFRQGTLTAKNLPLAIYLDMVRKQPRAHPSAEFIH